MEQQNIQPETAILATKKGYKTNSSGWYFYDEYGDLIFTTIKGGRSKKEKTFKLIPQNILQKWLREKHKIHVIIEPRFACYNIQLKQYNLKYDSNAEIDLKGLEFKDFETYEDALESALIEGLKLI